MKFIRIMVLGLLLLAAAAASAQEERLDQATLIDGLARQGMSELLLYLVEHENFDDPVLAKQVQISRHRVQYGQTKRPQQQRLEAFGRALTGLRQLIKKYRRHEQRPLWQTDMAELLLFDELQAQRQNAGEFYEFAVPTAEQRSAYENSVVEAYEMLADADYRFGQLQVELPRQPDHTEKRIDTGLWYRMMDQYFHLRTQVLLAHAAYYTALLDNNHPYYKTLGKNPFVRDQSRTPQAERRRLYQLAIERVDDFAQDPLDTLSLRRRCASLSGRARTALGDFSDAITNLTAASAGNQGDLTDLVARLGHARALERQGRLSEALQLLENLVEHHLVRSDLLMRLLVVDLTHRFLLRAAGSDAQAIAQAYEVYTPLLDDKSLGEKRAGLKQYVYRRWESASSADADASTLPPLVVLAIGEISRTDGQDLSAQAHEVEQAGDADQGAVLLRRAKPRIDRAATVLTQLLSRKHLSAPTRARAMFNLGAATYLQNELDRANLVNAVQLWMQLAQTMPDQPDAERAIGDAVSLLEDWHADPATRSEVDALYQQAAGMLFDKFPDSKSADNERFYFGASVLAPAGKFQQAAAMLGRVPPGHSDYFPAQRERLYALLELYRRTDPAHQPVLAQRIVAEARQLIERCCRAMGQAKPDQTKRIANTAGHAALVLSDLAMLRGLARQAAAQLDGFAQRYRDDSELVRLVLGKRIFALVAAGQFQPVVQQASTMMQSYPDDAALVIEQALDDLDARIDELGRRAAGELVDRIKSQLQSQSQALAQTAVKLGELLLDWADGRNFSDEDMLGYRLIYAKSLGLAGQFDQAVEVVTVLIANYREDADVISAAGEAYFMRGSEADLIRASAYFTTIILGYEQPPYPDIWWNAQLRRFQLMDKLGRQVQDVPLRVRALRQIDPQLGGGRYKQQMQRLANKYAR